MSQNPRTYDAAAKTVPGRHPSLGVLTYPYVLMGVVNVTPDSFYDGGRHDTTKAAVEFAQAMLDDGAHVLDIGGESSRPGSQEVSVEEELRRVVPVIEELRKASQAIISIDTRKSQVAKAAFAEGADWINDISAGRFDPEMATLAAAFHCPVVLMHSRATPDVMQKTPHYDDAVKEVCEELRTAVSVFEGAGVLSQNIIVDPGIGFGKRLEDNLALLRNLHTIAAMGYPVLVGTSRKSFVGMITGRDVQDRLAGTLAGVGVAKQRGAKIFRVHDVRETRDFLEVLSALEVS